MYYLRIAILLLVTDFILGAIEPTSDEFTHSIELMDDEKYHIFWKYDSENITFEIHTKTLGWVGFGLSPNGGMPGSDIIIGWVKDGVGYLKDRHAIAKSMPIVDESQDWTLVKSEERDSYTILTVTRKLKTGDVDDRCITMDTMRIIYSYHELDPESEDVIAKHTERGTKSAYLIGKAGNEVRKITNEESMDFIMSAGTVLNDKDTTYWCQAFRIPPPSTKKHFVMFEPIIQEGHESIVHHMLLYGCPFDDATAQELHGQHGHCQDGEEGFMAKMDDCEIFLAAWAIGGKQYWYPDNVGFPIDSNSPYLYKLEVHYDNPEYKSGIIDQSGLRFWMTDNLREIDAGILWSGHDVGIQHVIPPKSTGFISQGVCSSGCLGQAMEEAGVSEITIFAGALHTHLFGTAVRVRHIRDGKELPLIIDDNNYDFNFQDFKSTGSVTVKKGDSLIVECKYGTKDRTLPIFGGPGTQNEMCIAFLQYYPNIYLGQCVSMPDVPHVMTNMREGAKIEAVPHPRWGVIYQWTEPSELAGLNILEAIYRADWNKKQLEDFQRAVVNGKIIGMCESGDRDFSKQDEIEMNTPLVESRTDIDDMVEDDDMCPNTNAFQEFDAMFTGSGLRISFCSLLLFMPAVVLQLVY